MEIFYLDMRMEEVMQHTSSLAHITGIVVKLQVGGQVFQFFIKFQSLFQIERYAEEAYQVSGGAYPPYFQIKFISVNVSVDDLAIIHSSQISYFRRLKRQQKQAKENLQETQDRNLKNTKLQKCEANIKVLHDMRKSRASLGFVKNQGQEH